MRQYSHWLHRNSITLPAHMMLSYSLCLLKNISPATQAQLAAPTSNPVAMMRLLRRTEKKVACFSCLVCHTSIHLCSSGFYAVIMVCS